MQIFSISANGKLYQIGEDKGTSKWYLVTKVNPETLKQFKVNDLVDITHEVISNALFIKTIHKCGVNAPAVEKKIEEPKVEKKQEIKAPEVEKKAVPPITVKPNSLGEVDRLATAMILTNMMTPSTSMDEIKLKANAIYKILQNLGSN